MFHAVSMMIDIHSSSYVAMLSTTFENNELIVTDGL
jgi:hypothetical protein